MRPEYLPLPFNPDELYFPGDLVAENEQEVLVDCGAFDGDSIRKDRSSTVVVARARD